MTEKIIININESGYKNVHIVKSIYGIQASVAWLPADVEVVEAYKRKE